MSQSPNTSIVHVGVSIAGRNYRMACEAGDEKRIEGLAARVDARIAELATAFGAIDDLRLTVMAAFSLADDLAMAEQSLVEQREKLAEVKDQLASQEKQVMEALSTAAERIENITSDLTPTLQA